MTRPAGTNSDKTPFSDGAGGPFLVIGLPGTDLDPETAGFLSATRPAGVILFRRNIHSAEALFHLIAELKSLLGKDLIVGVDLEGGTVNRFSSLVPDIPGAMQIAATGNPELARQAGYWTGKFLSLFGFSLNFAPVLDCTFHFRQNALGTRTFGSDAERVTEMADAYVRGLRQNGIQCTGKHFPGLGRADLDSHDVLPCITADRQDLDRHDLVPFRSLLPSLDLIMIGHGAYPALLAGARKPASMASEIITNMLKSAMGYRGPVISDDLDMGAFTSLPDFQAGASAAFSAGCDLLLVCHDRDRMELAATGIRKVLASEPGGKLRGEEAGQKIKALKENAAARVPAFLDPRLLSEVQDAFRGLAEEVAKKSVTRVTGRWEPVQGKCLLCYPGASSDLRTGAEEPGPLLSALREQGVAVDTIRYPRDIPEDLPEALATRFHGLRDVTVLFVTENAHGNRNCARFARELKKTGSPVIHLSLGLPGDCPAEAVDASLAVYAASAPSLHAAAAVLAGRLSAEGRLPVAADLMQQAEEKG